MRKLTLLCMVLFNASASFCNDMEAVYVEMIQEMPPEDEMMVPMDYCSEPIYEYEVVEYIPIYYRPPRRDWGYFSASAELLIWEAREEGLDYGVFIPLFIDPTDIPFAPSQTPAVVAPTKFNPGLRLELDYHFPCFCSAVDTEVIWTHYRTRQTNATFDAPVAAFFVPLLMSPFGEPIANHINAEWKLLMDVVDVETGYALSWERYKFMFRPHFGVRAAWMDQNLNADYLVLFQAFAPNGGSFVSLNKNNFMGIGLRYGADTAWNFWKGWSLFGKGGSSLLWGEWNVTQHVMLNESATINGVVYPAGLTVSNQSSKRHQMAAEVDLSGGIAWRRILPAGNQHCFTLYQKLCNMDLTLSLAWEFQIWFSQNQMLNTVGPNGLRYINLNGDLYLQGLTFRADVNF